MALENNWIFTCQKIKLVLHLSPWTENHIKWVKALYSTFEVLKWLEENMGWGWIQHALQDSGVSRVSWTEQPQLSTDEGQPETETVHAQKRKLPEEQRAYGMEDVFTSCAPDKGLISWVYKELQKLHSKEMQLPISQWANSSDVLQEKKRRWPIFKIVEIQMKTTL